MTTITTTTTTNTQNGANQTNTLHAENVAASIYAYLLPRLNDQDKQALTALDLALSPTAPESDKMRAQMVLNEQGGTTEGGSLANRLTSLLMDRLPTVESYLVGAFAVANNPDAKAEEIKLAEQALIKAGGAVGDWVN